MECSSPFILAAAFCHGPNTLDEISKRLRVWAQRQTCRAALCVHPWGLGSSPHDLFKLGQAAMARQIVQDDATGFRRARRRQCFLDPLLQAAQLACNQPPSQALFGSGGSGGRKGGWLIEGAAKA